MLIKYFDKQVNVAVLTRELQAQISDVAGVSTKGLLVFVNFISDPPAVDDIKRADSIIQAHDPAVVTDEQQREFREAAYNDAPELNFSSIRLLLLEMVTATGYKSPLADAMRAKRDEIDALYPLSDEAVAAK